MAYTAIAPQVTAGPYISEGAAAQMTTLTWTAGDATNLNEVTMTTKRILILVRNVSGGAAGTVTVTSSDDPYGRTSDITTFSVADTAFAGRIFEAPGWEQTLGGRNLLLTPSATTMEFLAIPL